MKLSKFLVGFLGVFLILIAFTIPGNAKPINIITNGGFEDGLNGWTTSGQVEIVSGTAFDEYSGGYLPMVAQGINSARLGDPEPWWLEDDKDQFSSLQQEFEVNASTTNNVLQFAYAVVAYDPPSHMEEDRPWFQVTVTDLTDPSTPPLMDTYAFTDQESGKWYVAKGGQTGAVHMPFHWTGGDAWVFIPWTEVIIPLDDFAGHRIQVKFEVRDCNLGAHAAYGYLDAAHVGAPTTLQLPGLGGDGNPQVAVYSDPPFWGGVLIGIEKIGISWICLVIPLLLLLLLLLAGLLNRRRGEVQPLPAVSVDSKKRETEVVNRGGARPKKKEK